MIMRQMSIQSISRKLIDAWVVTVGLPEVLNYRLLRALSDFPLFVLISIDARTLVYKFRPLYPVASSFPFLD